MSSRIGIEIKNVRKKLGPNHALDGISILFEPGYLHGIIGPDGAGKTTLLRHLMGLLKPNEGEILFYDHGDLVPFVSVRPHIAYMPQQQSLYGDLSISEHLDFFRDLYQIPKETYHARREALLSLTRLKTFTDRPAGKLSGGMYKKLGLMCTLLQSPSLILLDEPTNGVDPISRREFWELLYRLVSEGILILITTAYMDEAERCGRIHILEKGKCLIEGEPQKVLQQEGVKNLEELFLRKEPLKKGTA